MKRYNNFLIVGIDHGYGNIKTANTVTPTGITKLDAAPTFTKNTLYYDGSYYLIGEGHKEYLPDKWQDNDNYLFTLMGIARELNREGITSADVHLAVGLPLTWVNRQREDFRKYMLQHESVDFKYEDKMTCFRFNLDNPEHAKAWEYLHSIDKDKVKSGNTAVVRAVNDYFDRMQKLSDDPYFETRQREERFVEQIVTEVGKAFTAEMPKFLASLMLNLNAGYPMPIPQTAVSAETESSKNTDDSDNVDYSAIDFGFIGG